MFFRILYRVVNSLKESQLRKRQRQPRGRPGGQSSSDAVEVGRLPQKVQSVEGKVLLSGIAIQGSNESESPQIGQSSPLNVVLISDSVPQFDQVPAAAIPNSIVITYDSRIIDTDALVAILDSVVTEHEHQQIGHLALVTHGASGVIDIGRGEVWNTSGLGSSALAFARLRDLLTLDARLDLYACSVAAGVEGRTFVDALATATGADVYASDNVVGSGATGDFVWEYRTAQYLVTLDLLSTKKLELISGLYLADTTLPSVNLTAPNSGTFTVGQTITITGTGSDANGIDHTWFELYKGGSRVDYIYQGGNGSGLKSSYNWVVPDVTPGGHTINGTDYKIKMIVWDPAGNASGDSSTSNLTLLPADTTLPSVDLTAPNSGTFTVGQTITITGTNSDASGISHVQIELYKGGTAPNNRVGIILPGNIGDGDRTSHSWTILNTLNGQALDGTDYKIKWIAWDDSSVHNPNAAFSAGWLTIRPVSTPAATFIAPWGPTNFSYYNSRSFYYDQNHLGADINLVEGTSIRAGVAGKIVNYAAVPGYGTLVVAIEVDLGQPQTFTNAYGGSVQTSKVLWILGHLRSTQNRDGSGNQLNWTSGNMVSANDIVGYIQNDDDNGDGAEHVHVGLRLQSEQEAQSTDGGKWLRGYEVNADGTNSGMGIYYADAIAALNLQAGTPSAPTGLVARSNGAGAIFVDWASVSGAGDYRLFRSTSATGSWTQIYLDSQSQYNDSNDPTPHLTPGQPYYYYAVAVNSAGDSPPSAVYGPVTPNASPAVPTNLQAVAQTGTPAIKLMWNPVNGAAQYQVERSTTSNGSYLRVGDADQASYRDGDVLVGTPYYYRVRAVVNGIVSDPSVVSTATITQIEQHAADPSPTPTLTAPSYDGIAKVYLWDWESQGWVLKLGQPPNLGQPVVNDLGSVIWSNKTIILTHGWNDQLDQGATNEYMEIFAKHFQDDRDDFAKYNILAVDWNDNNSPKGANPNGLSTSLDFITNTFVYDANVSAANGIKAAIPLGQAFVDAGIQPGKVMLIGHSNGAGFMASLAATIYVADGRTAKIDELVALDAPFETLSYWTTMLAAPFVNRLSNYYQPLSSLVLDLSAHNVNFNSSWSFGAAMFPLAGNVTNYALSADVSDQFFPNEFGHSQVPLRFAWSADGSSHQVPWGYETSGFANGGVATESGLLLVESGPYYFDNTGGTFEVAVPAWSAVSASVLQQIKDLGQGLRNAFVQGGRSVWDASIRVEQNIQNVLQGINSALTIPDSNYFGGGSFGGGGGGGSWQIDGTAHSPVYVQVDVRVPDDAALLHLSVEVQNPGNNDIVQVALDNQILGTIDLAALTALGKYEFDFWVSDFAGQTTQLQFYMPSSTSSSAVFSLSKIEFESVPFRFTVTNTDDSGSGSLRQAIMDANNHLGADRIQFVIGTGLQTIAPLSALPEITDPVVIDATTQPGFTGQPLIELDGTNAGNSDGLKITAGNSVVRGLVIGGFQQSGIVLADGDNNVVEGNFIGTGALGTVSHGNDFGVKIEAGSAGNRIGTDGNGVNDAAERNILSGNRADGVLIKEAGSDNNSVSGNLIGTNLAGTASLSNNYGVRIESGAKGNRIGTNGDGLADAAERNVISGNRNDGVLIIGTATSTNTITGNYIGVDATGLALGNFWSGVEIIDSSNNRIGGTASGTGNTISNNGFDGVAILSGSGNAILGNSISSNNWMGIDLKRDGVTFNDSDDSDMGPNNLQNFPVLQSSTVDVVRGTTTITGSLISTPDSQFRVELFASDVANATGHGEGKQLLWASSVTTDSAGFATILASLPTAIPAGYKVTATATDVNGNTSEFSRAITLVVPPSATLTSAPNVTQAGGTNYEFQVTYTDDVAVDVTSLGSSNVYTTAPGTNFGWIVTYLGVDNNTNGVSRIATYRMYVPGGSWDPTDNGVYTVRLMPYGVRDTSGNTAPDMILGTFTVAINVAPVIGAIDIVGLANGGWWVAQSTGTSFLNETWGAWSMDVALQDVQMADVNGDGRDDIVGRTDGGWWVAKAMSTGFVNEFWGGGAMSVTWQDVQVADVNGDGRDDIVGRADGAWWVAKSTGTAFESELWGGWSTAATWVDVQVADVNGDGRDDIVGRANGAWWVAKTTGTAFVNELWGVWSTGVAWQEVQVADVNGDGRDDIVGRAEGARWVALSTGTSFVSEQWGAWPTDVPLQDVHVADVDGDGRADIVGRADGGWWVARSTGTAFVNDFWGGGATSVAWQDVQVADVNGDGRTDIVGRADGLWWVAKSTGTAFENELWGSWSTDVTWADILVGNFSSPADVGGAFEAAVVETVVNEVPVIGAFDTAVTDTVIGSVVLLDSNATVTDVDKPRFNGDVLTISLTDNADEATNRLEFRPVTRLVGVSESNLRFREMTVASFTDGIGVSPLIMTFNANATESTEQTVLSNVTDRSVSANPPTLPHIVRVTLTDGGGGASNLPTKTINFAPGAAPLAIELSAPSVALNQPRSTTAGSFSAADSDAGITLIYAPVVTASSTDNNQQAQGLLSFLDDGDGLSGRRKRRRRL